ncbi:MAG: DUF4411 family protein [Proteobacteria bacterium]|nr:DUF4411 family protein [Pseudomonadota bacterium]
MKEEDVKNALLLDEEADPGRVSEITAMGYARDLDEAEIDKIGRDPFLISYGYADVENRFVVTFESSAPNKQRSNRKIPDVCNQFNVQCGNIYDVIEALDFTTDWVPD